MVLVVTVPMIPCSNRGYVGWQFPTPTGCPANVPNPNGAK